MILPGNLARHDEKNREKNSSPLKLLSTTCLSIGLCKVGAGKFESAMGKHPHKKRAIIWWKPRRVSLESSHIRGLSLTRCRVVISLSLSIRSR